jgi:hypothetical protein
MRCFTDGIVTDKHGDARENARDVLKDDGSGNQAVVTLGVLQLHLILNHPASGGNAL